MPVAGFVSGRSPVESAYLVAAFRQGLSEIGYVEGQNIAIEYRWAEGDLALVPALAAELVERGVAVLATVGGGMLEAVKSVKTIPIVFVFGADPVAAGMVTSLNRPSANATGVALINYTLDPKRLEILREFANDAVIAVLVNPNNPDTLGADRREREIEAAARVLGTQIQILRAGSDQMIDAAFRSIKRLHAGALLVSADAYYVSRRHQLVVLSAHYAIPTLYHTREIAAAGGLMSYGASISDGYRQVGTYVGRILRGARPADLPVVQPTKFEFVINLKTAKALGLEIPPTLLARADEVIE
jgi:putative ABC transport system substrate-binding protein